MSATGNEHLWYAVAVKPRHEKIVALALQGKGYDQFLPLYRSYHHSGRHLQEVLLPLFPGYVFSAFDLLTRLPVLTIPGVLYIVGIGRVPTPVDRDELAAIEAVARAGLEAEPIRYLAEGDLVRIERGALRGFEGRLIGVKRKSRIVLSVSLLQRAIAVEIDPGCVRAIHRGEQVRCRGGPDPAWTAL